MCGNGAEALPVARASEGRSHKEVDRALRPLFDKQADDIKGVKACYFKDFSVLVSIDARETRFGIIGKPEHIKVRPVMPAEILEARAGDIDQSFRRGFYLFRYFHAGKDTA